MRDLSVYVHRLVCTVVILYLSHLTMQPAAAQEAGTGRGHLVVSSVPSGLPVYMDETLMGMTPIVGYEVTAGRHTVRVVSPDPNDWDMRDWVREIAVAPGETVSAHAVFIGTVTVMSVPFDADVYVDGEWAGLTPLRLRDLAPGVHAVSIRKRGYEPVARSVAVSDTARQPLTVELTPTGETISMSHSQTGHDRAQRVRRVLGYATLGTGLVCSGLAVVTRHRANEAYDRYQQTGDPAALERFYQQTNRYDKMAGVFIGMAQVNFLASFYFFLSRAFRGQDAANPTTDR